MEFEIRKKQHAIQISDLIQVFTNGRPEDSPVMMLFSSVFNHQLLSQMADEPLIAETHAWLRDLDAAGGDLDALSNAGYIPHPGRCR